MNSLKDVLSGLLDAAPEPMVIIDRAGNIVVTNSCIESTFGYSPSELVGLPVETLMPERYRASHAQHRHNYFQRPVIRPMGTDMELNGRRKDGTEFPVEISLGPFKSEDGPFVWAVIRDSTPHKLLAQEKSFSDSLLETVPAIIVLLDSEGRITRINSYMEQLSGYLNHEVAGKDWFTTFLPDEDQAQIRDLFGEVMRTDVNVGHVNPIVTRSGVLRQIEWHARTLTDERGRVTLLNVGHDITERMAYEEGLRRAANALREAEHRKDEFLAMLGHELRNPLGAVSNALELADVLSGTDAVLKNRDLMQRQVKQLTQLVDDLRDISLLTRGVLRISQQRVDLNDIVRSAANDMQWLIDKAGHSLSLAIPQEPMMVYVDPARMTQVLGNLISNAAKYTPSGGQIDLGVEPTPGGARVSVKDNGVGIPPEKLESIFDMFAQLNLAGHDSEGQGIGLSLARTFIEMHGGTITAYSAGAEQGSEFVIWIPTYAPMALIR